MKKCLTLCFAVCMLFCKTASAGSLAADGFIMPELPADEVLNVNLDKKNGDESVCWTQAEDGMNIKLTVTDENGTQTKWSADCSGAQVWITDLDGKDSKKICVSGDPMSDDDVTWCLTYEDGTLKPMLFEESEYVKGRVIGMGVEGLILSGNISVMGTRSGTRHLTSEDGKLVLSGDGLWHFEYDLESDETWTQQALTAKTTVPVIYVNLMEEESPGELTAGEKILITAADDFERVWFTIQDGRTGYLNVAPNETAGWGYLIGGVEENTLFDGIRYMG